MGYPSRNAVTLAARLHRKADALKRSWSSNVFQCMHILLQDALIVTPAPQIHKISA
jgi:hypothetical protein